MNKNKRLAVILVGIVICFGFGDRVQARDKIILKSIVINPSKTKIQKAMLKTYLPKEVKPEDVVGMEDLQIGYDISQELYYVYKEFKLEPGKSVTRSVEIRDVWVVSIEELDNLVSQAGEFVEKLKNTVHSEDAAELQKLIEEKYQTILTQQTEAQDALPPGHIAAYRRNIVMAEEIKDSLAKMDEMVLKLELTKPGGRQARIFVGTAWWVILAVIIFLGAVSLIFFFVWQQQAKISEIESKKE